MTDYITHIFGHLGQLAPAHIVITSPHFDSREIICGGQGARRDQHKYTDAPIDKIIAMHEAGVSFNRIAVELDLPVSTVKDWHKRAAK